MANIVEYFQDKISEGKLINDDRDVLIAAKEECKKHIKDDCGCYYTECDKCPLFPVRRGNYRICDVVAGHYGAEMIDELVRGRKI